MGYLKALTSKRLWFNFALALAVLITVVLVAWFSLSSYTRHNDKVTVPDLEGLTEHEAFTLLQDRNLKAVIIDSVYTDKVARGTVFMQTPVADHVVKPERKVYITMNCQQRKKLKMPDLMNQSKRLALTMLELSGLKLGNVDERRDQCDGCVVDMLYKGKKIKAGTVIMQGESIDLILGSGTGADPYLDQGDENSEGSEDEASNNDIGSIDNSLQSYSLIGYLLGRNEGKSVASTLQNILEKSSLSDHYES